MLPFLDQLCDFFLKKILLFHFSSWFKRSLIPLLIIFFPIIINGQKYSISISFDLNNFKIEKVDSFNTIQCIQNNDIRYFLPGYPKLPYVSFFVLLPHNSKIEHISIDGLNFENIEGFYNIIPTTLKDIDTVSGYSYNTRYLKFNDSGNSEIYYPPEILSVQYDSSQLYAGFLIHKIYICPFRYYQKRKKLLFSPEVTLEINYHISDKPLQFETSPEKIRLSREFIRKTVINTEEIDKILPLKQKLDYSKIQIFRDIGKDSGNNKTVVPKLKKLEKNKPFYIKHIITK